MGQSAATMEKAIDEAVLGCTSLRAIGLWFKMFNVIKANRTNDTQPTEDQFSLSLDRLASMVGPSKATHDERRANARRIISPLRRLRIDSEPLIQRRGREYVAMPLYRVARERFRVQELIKALRYARKRNVTPEPAFTPEQAISPGNGEGLALRYAEPPKVFPPTTPLSYPPNSKISHARGGESRGPTDVQKTEAFAAFDRWSRHGRGHELDALADEYRKVSRLLDALLDEPPIIRGSESTPQPSMVPLAVSMLQKRANFVFKSVDYACTAVKNELALWVRTGVPGVSTTTNGKPAQTPLKETKERDYRPQRPQRSNAQ